MKKYQEDQFKLGDTTLDSTFFITIPEYGVPIPECNSHGPIGYPIRQPLYNIINMIERGLHVQMSNEDAEKMFLFVNMYNKMAMETNKEAGEVLNPLISTTEDYLALKIKCIESNAIAKEKEENVNPFNYPIIPPKRTKTNVYTNERVQNVFKKKNKKKRAMEIIQRPARMYDEFNEHVNINSNGVVVNNDLDMSRDVPDYFSNINFGDN